MNPLLIPSPYWKSIIPSSAPENIKSQIYFPTVVAASSLRPRVEWPELASHEPQRPPVHHVLVLVAKPRKEHLSGVALHFVAHVLHIVVLVQQSVEVAHV